MKIPLYRIRVFPARDTQLHAPESQIGAEHLTLEEALVLAKQEEAKGWRTVSIEVQNWKELV